jgi:alkaline phosphatase D
VDAVPPVTFTHGVASGDVTDRSAVLWTRVDRNTLLKIEVSPDPSFHVTHFKRVVQASAENDFTAKVVASPLLPNQPYFYRWRHGSAVSEVGTFTTAPPPTASASVRFTWTGDSDGTKVNGLPAWNHFETLDAVRDEAADFFVYLGDTVYPDSVKRTSPPAVTLDEYRDTYKVNRDYAALRDLLGATSSYVIWDDHEVRDDYAGQTVDPRLYANGREAFLEYLPLVDTTLPSAGCAGSPMFRVFRWGRDVDLIILDTHSCRSADARPVCTYPSPPFPPGTFDFAPTLPDFLRAAAPAFFPPLSLIPACLPTIHDPARTLLGAEQKQLFKDALRTSTATFKFVLSPSTMGQTYANPYSRWEGYAAERAEILAFIREPDIPHVIFLSTDDHQNLINDVFADRVTDPTPVAREFVAGPVAHLTNQGIILGFFGLPPDTNCQEPANAALAGCQALAFFQDTLSFLGVDCRHLNRYSYGLVAVDAGAETATLTLKDEGGNVLHDQLNPAITCTQMITP